MGLAEFEETLPRPGPRPDSRAPPPSQPVGESRFLPGTIVADRYRIFGLLGRGGMGEVYRADDLKLGQPVALKFLPDEVSTDRERLDRFLNEVRTARQVAHLNVCRVHDIGEVDGLHYLSMEYVDGEDLASLLRRIGRLPQDKAIQIARQLCAGLAAAHNQGILHRDLKPANVMIDGRGGVRITDFGLAMVAESVEGEAAREGTPSYMAPEQLAGRSVTAQTDIYALGLILYELFTGERALKARSAAEMKRLQDSAIATPSSIIEGLDPAVERTVLRCLEREPVDRPPTALSVAAALPGGDPLAAALAAGETPSPELVAAAGETDAMHPAHALGLATIAIALFFAAAWLNGRNDLRAYVPIDKPPAAMVDRAQEVIAKLGYTESVYSDPVDTAFGYSIWTGKLQEIEDNDKSPDRWARLQSPDVDVVSFWYRQSPTTMIPRPQTPFPTGGPVGRWNPFPATTGGILVSLDPAGQLRFFVHTPRRYHTDPWPTEEPDWSLPFELAALDMGDFEPAEPRYQRFMAPEQRAAWVGELPGQPDRPVRIELGMSDRRVTIFAIVDRWELETREGEPGNLPGPPWQGAAALALMLALLAVGVALARHNLRQGRADRRGGGRVAVASFTVILAFHLLRSHGLATWPGFPQILAIFGWTVFGAIVILVFYLALEPYARRIWPSMLVAWSRLVCRPSPGWRDPLVGRSVLAGTVAGAAIRLLDPLQHWGHSLIAGLPARPNLGNWDILLGTRVTLAEVDEALLGGIAAAFLIAFVLVVARLLIRRTAIAVVAATAFFALFVLIGGGVSAGSLPHALIQIGFAIVGVGILVAVLLRFGLLAAIATTAVSELNVLAGSADWSAWHARPAVLTIAIVAAIALYGYWAASAGRSFLGEEQVEAPVSTS